VGQYGIPDHVVTRKLARLSGAVSLGNDGEVSMKVNGNYHEICIEHLPTSGLLTKCRPPIAGNHLPSLPPTIIATRDKTTSLHTFSSASRLDSPGLLSLSIISHFIISDFSSVESSFLCRDHFESTLAPRSAST